MVKELQLSNGEVALVDDEDYPFLEKHTWARIGRYGYPAIVVQKPDGSKKWFIYLHRMVTPGYREADHINHNVLDAQKHNLRPMTHQLNGWNKGPNKTHRGKPTASQYKGLQYRPLRGQPRWLAMIRHVEPGAHKSTGKTIYIGYFFNEDDAARAYNAMARQLRGEWAWQNTVPGDTTEALQSRVSKEREELLALQESGRATYAQKKRYQALAEVMNNDATCKREKESGTQG